MTECRRQSEVRAALRSGAPLDELHIAECASCAETFAVAHQIAEDIFAPPSAAVPTSGGVWWRVERRARDEAARNAARTVTRVHRATVGIVAMLAILALGGIPTLQSWASQLAVAAPGAQWGVLIVLTIAAFTVLTVAIYFALSDD